nr:unnamed protein product [Callosobruchus analis]
MSIEAVSYHTTPTDKHRRGNVIRRISNKDKKCCGTSLWFLEKTFSCISHGQTYM